MIAVAAGALLLLLLMLMLLRVWHERIRRAAAEWVAEWHLRGRLLLMLLLLRRARGR